ncbi:hypothetical protein DGWBC_0359 [Dehalogenimonas sp. WBC-2]|nr:hypothetical protein DGWBC_0359 [Dehalogenimonas sp. WBC-2]
MNWIVFGNWAVADVDIIDRVLGAGAVMVMGGVGALYAITDCGNSADTKITAIIAADRIL